MDARLAAILDDARAQIARGDEPDAAALTSRIEALPDHDRALAQLNRLLAVARAKRALAPPTPLPAPAPRPQREVYRAKPTIAANMNVRAREHGDAVVLEWDVARGVGAWDARIADRPDARSPYADRETLTLTAPSLELRLDELPQRVSITGRNSAGRIVQRAVVSGLTRANWRQKWQQRASAS
ncbi:MAG: hypothetical protein ABUS54_08145 [Actinomycetota bacterium]